MDESGTKAECEALGEGQKRKCQDGKEMVFKEPGKAQKKTPQGHQDLAFQKEQPGKGQEEIPLEEGSRKLKPLEYPP